LLFTGIEGVGKRTAALAFAMALNCSNRKKRLPVADTTDGGAAHENMSHETASACGRCRSCRKIVSGNHPDIIRVQPAGAFIRIDQIRELCRVLAMKPYEAEYRNAVIFDAHCMNAEAGNALLKMLEEPPYRTILVLTATTATDMLPTIVSRCRHIRFNPIPVPLLARELVETHGLDSESAHGLAVLSGGSLSKARELPHNNWINRRRWLLDNFDMLVPYRNDDKHPSRLFAVASLLHSDKNMVMDSLEILKSVYRDLLIYKYQPDNLLNPDAKPLIAHAAETMEVDGISVAVKAIDTAIDRIRSNVNPRLALETLFLTLAKSPEMN
jgi:DNA polymerase-3 subunit delta'